MAVEYEQGRIAPPKGGSLQSATRPWQSEKDPVKALHHVVQHLTGYGQSGGSGPPLTKSMKLDLASALQPLIGPYTSQITSALNAGAATAGKGASPQMTEASMAAPDLGQYLGQISQGLGINPGALGSAPGGAKGLEGILTSGLAGIGAADQQLPGAIGQQAAGAGNAGLLADLLNAARYQAIYKQAAYAPAPSAAQDPALAQLYNTVVAGGAALSGPGSLALTPPGKTPKPGGSSTGAGSSPFGQ